MTKPFTGIYRPAGVDRPFPEPFREHGITSHNWSWTGGGSDSFASAQGRQLLFAGVVENLDALRRELDLPPDATAAGTALQLHLRHGDDFALRIQGGFCFAILDCLSGGLLLVRDFLGRQSLFWGRTPQGFYVFSDRLGSLRRLLPGGLSETDLPALDEYLARGCISAPRTIHRGIRRVEAATRIRILGDGRIRVRRYWHPEYLPKRPGSFAAAVEECHALLEDAVRQACAGRDRVACLLSGGLDSSLVLAHARSLPAGRPLKAVTVSFPDPRYDEAPLACLTAAGLDTPLEVVRARPEDLGRVGARILGSLDEPYSDSSLLPLALACGSFPDERQAVLTGDGGDEVFGGYRRYQAMLWRRLLANLPGRALLNSICFLRQVLDAAPEQRGPRSSLRRFVQAMRRDVPDAFLGFQEVFSPEFRRELCRGRESAGKELPARAVFACLEAEDDCERCMALDLLGYLPCDCLRKCELAALGKPLEMVSPLLARPLVEFALRLPRAWKTTILQRKRPLRQLARRMLPGRLLLQRKRGFAIPLADWLRTDWADQVRALAADHRSWDSEGWLDAGFIEELTRQHLQRLADHAAAIWNLLCLRKWLENQRNNP